jgi:hypothetical protein
MLPKQNLSGDSTNAHLICLPDLTPVHRSRVDPKHQQLESLSMTLAGSRCRKERMLLVAAICCAASICGGRAIGTGGAGGAGTDMGFGSG